MEKNKVLSPREKRALHASLFNEYAGLTEEQLLKGITYDHTRSRDIIMNNDELMVSIFAPDPNTGVPRSDMAIIMSKDAAPEVAQYIRDTLMRPLGDVSGSDDADVALEMMKHRNEDLAAYGDRIQQIIQKYSNQESKTE